MNEFFRINGDVSFDVPSEAFARFDQSEPGDIGESEQAVFIFSAVNADWMRSSRLFWHVDRPDDVREFWAGYWSALFAGAPRGPDSERPPDMFRELPLLRYEITVGKGDDKALAILRNLAEREAAWIRIVLDDTGAMEADVYGNLFSVEGRSHSVSLDEVGEDEASALSFMFDMNLWPDASIEELEAALQTSQRAEGLAVFDVGQGSATALLDEGQLPFLYHDLGAGVTRNTHTTPTPLQFCWTNDPVVVLSHWDSDHWAGARHDTRALSRTWIAPRQSIGPTHSAFASDILTNGGALLIWHRVSPITIHNAKWQEMTFGQCSGRDRNGSCIALRVDDDSGGLKHWLMTGDAGYHQLPFPLPGDVVGLVMPHHGAKMSGTRHAPKAPPGYCRVMFSFGPGNAHGRTAVRHPTEHAVDAHESKGWDAGTWSRKVNPGDSFAGGDVFATALHPSTHLGGAVCGWDRDPVPIRPRPCSGSGCTAEIDQP